MCDSFKADSVAGFDWLTKEGRQTLKDLCNIPVLSVGSEVGVDIKKCVEVAKDKLRQAIIGIDPMVAQMRLVWECQDLTHNPKLTWMDLTSDPTVMADIKDKYPSGFNQIQAVVKLLELKERLKAFDVALSILWHE